LESHNHPYSCNVTIKETFRESRDKSDENLGLHVRNWRFLVMGDSPHSSFKSKPPVLGHRPRVVVAYARSGKKYSRTAVNR
jgi:hypothetical protein